MNVACAIVAVFALVQVGEALRCWSCSSDMDAPCADYFNITNFNRFYRYDPRAQTPQLMDCDQQQSAYPINQRPVCMKKKQTTYGRTTYVRQCRFLHPEERIGTCPTETTSSATTIDFCEYCEHDGCNGASLSSASVILAALVPAVVLAVVLRQ